MVKPFYRLFAGLMSCLLAGISLAGDVTIVRAGGYLDVREGRMVQPAEIVIEGNRIAAVNPEELPDGAQLIELGERILLPGLMDAHTHLTLDIEPGCVTRPVTWKTADFALRGGYNAELTLMA